jgi:hypothetical protein
MGGTLPGEGRKVIRNEAGETRFWSLAYDWICPLGPVGLCPGGTKMIVARHPAAAGLPGYDQQSLRDPSD